MRQRINHGEAGGGVTNQHVSRGRVEHDDKEILSLACNIKTRFCR
jgi:hypothetical protein